MEACKKKKRKGHLELTAYIFWQIWKARNEAVFNNHQQEKRWVCQKALNEWIEYDEGLNDEQGKQDQQRNVREEIKWQVSVGIG